MLRANLGKCTPADAVDALAEDGVVARTHAIAPTALRVEAGARRVAGSRAYRAGLVELQDGSSQAAMAALPVPEGGRVLDYCAGGGGKVLALAARASAAWFAHDAAPQRMADLPARAGVDVRVLAPGESPSQAPFDLVLCDVPCSGSGTWRRTPDAKWRLTPEDLEALMRRQDAILDAAAPLVAPAGRLAYATCSVLAEENIDRVTAFCSRAPGWRIADSRTWPVSDAGDGFFLAILSRKDGL
jgi:16S rRNA (cytosine967-C5)-methyltransferase